MPPRINYIICMFIGKRRNRSIASVEMVQMQLDYLQDNNIPLTKVTVVCNLDEAEHYQIILGNMKKFINDYYTELEFIPRLNQGFSYRAWSEAINRELESNNDYDYYFLIEDDCLPARKDFIDVFLEPMKGKVCYVCQRLSVSGPKHAGMSSGILCGKASRKVYDKMGSVLRTTAGLTYASAQHDQRYFLENLIDMGYELTDCSHLASMPFYEKFSDEKVGRIIEYGDPDLPPVLIPIIRKEYWNVITTTVYDEIWERITKTTYEGAE